MFAAQRGGMGASQSTVMISPPYGALHHTRQANREETEIFSLLLFLSVQLSTGFKMSLSDLNNCTTSLN